MTGPAEAVLRRLSALLEAHRDVIEHRVESPDAPAWAERRGWTRYLGSLSDEALGDAERRGPAPVFAGASDAPPSLRALAREARDAVVLEAPMPTTDVRALLGAGVRKRAQIAALTEWARSTGADHIVDVGSGHGHLTRELARTLSRSARGIERSAPSVARARSLNEPEVDVRFDVEDADSLQLTPRDLAVGLHACGALGDLIVERAGRAGAGVLLVGCCYQKIRGPARAPASPLGRSLGLDFGRRILGLANLATVAEGAGDADGVMDRRRTRYALRRLLMDHGVALDAGDEAQGIGRRRFRRPLAEIAAAAFAVRDLPPPSGSAIREAERRAASEHGRMRRWALARTLLARPLELAIAADRASALDGARLVTAFHNDASPRNIAILRRPTG